MLSVDSGRFSSIWTLKDVANIRSKQLYIYHIGMLSTYFVQLLIWISTVICSHRISFRSSVDCYCNGCLPLIFHISICQFHRYDTVSSKNMMASWHWSLFVIAGLCKENPVISDGLSYGEPVMESLCCFVVSLNKWRSKYSSSVGFENSWHSCYAAVILTYSYYFLLIRLHVRKHTMAYSTLCYW